MTTHEPPHGQAANDTHRRLAVGDPDTAQTKRLATTTQGPSERADPPHGQGTHDTQCPLAVGGPDRPAGAGSVSPPKDAAPRLADGFLLLAAEVVDDLERVRIANANRLRIMTTDEPDPDGIHRGYGLTLDHPDVARLAGIVDAMATLEKQAVKGLEKRMRAHPLGPWAKAQKGLGDKQIARLLAAIGDPYWNTLHNRPRTVSELWAYCGLHTLPTTDQGRADDQIAIVGGGGQTGSDPDQPPAVAQEFGVRVAARRRKGQRANWSNTARMRAHNCAVSCVKQPNGTPYRDVYTARRAHTATTHPDWTDGHSHHDALRILAKRILRDLWRAARDHHQEPTP